MGTPTPPIGGPGAPSGPRGQQPGQAPESSAFQKAVEKIEKVAEAENEGRSKQKYKTQEELEGEAPTPPPTPMTLFSALPAVEPVGGEPVPSPSYSPPPSASAPPTPPAGPTDTFAGLPTAPEFYDEIDVPDTVSSPPSPNPQGKAEETVSKEKGKKGVPLLPGEKEKAQGGPASLPGSEAEEAPSSRFPFEEPKWVTRYLEKEEKAAALPPGVKSTPPETAGAPPSKKGKKEMAPISKDKEELPQGAPWMQPETPSGKEGMKKKEKEIEPISAPSSQPLPSHIDAMAQSAVQTVARYLSPETAPLFYQMVGTILVMTSPPGISRTEVVLNAETFRSSVFYGSTITIEKYATAPDSLNIRLTGSPEAVTVFNQNLPTLATAFREGNFKFRVGRLEAEYSTERPLFKRKERGGKGSASGDTGGMT